jgi:hypothetical protein
VRGVQKLASKKARFNEVCITIMTLNSLFPSYVAHGEQVFLKIDTQGYTKKVRAVRVRFDKYKAENFDFGKKNPSE